MRLNRAWYPILALIALVSGAAQAYAGGTCTFRCSCDVSCNTPCSEGPGLPILTCGQYTYEPCIGKPVCEVALRSTRNSSFSNSDFQLIFSSPAPAPTAALVNR